MKHKYIINKQHVTVNVVIIGINETVQIINYWKIKLIRAAKQIYQNLPIIIFLFKCSLLNSIKIINLGYV